MQIDQRYMVMVLIPVPSNSIPRVFAIHRQTAQLYKQLGAVDVEISLLADGSAKYGCLGLNCAVPLTAGEQLMMVVDSFTNKESYSRASKTADKDSAISNLFEELSALVDISRIVRAEFETPEVQDNYR